MKYGEITSCVEVIDKVNSATFTTCLVIPKLQTVTAVDAVAGIPRVKPVFIVIAMTGSVYSKLNLVTGLCPKELSSQIF